MLQALDGMVKLRVLLAGMMGPPKGPFGRRVSVTRQGVTG